MTFAYAFSTVKPETHFEGKGSFLDEESALKVARSEYAAMKDEDKRLYNKIYICRVQRPDHSYFLPSVKLILDHIDCAASHFAEGCDYSYLDCSKEAKLDLDCRLQGILHQWIKDYNISAPAFYDINNMSVYELIE